MKKNLLNKKGFTLIELIVVIAILAILALILVPSITGYISKATEAKNTANARTYYSEVALAVATTPSRYTDGTTYYWPQTNETTALTTAPTSTTKMWCTFVVDKGAVTDTFSCKLGNNVYSLANDFKLSN